MTERIFTQNNLLTIRTMAEEGRSATEIAKSIGSTPASVRVVCSHHKIKIGRGQPPDHDAIVVRMDGTLSAEFRCKAEELQIPVSELATKLLSAIVTSNIYEAVLDEDKSHPASASAA